MMPPYIIYNSKNLYKDWIMGGPDGVADQTSTKGWMKADIYLDWLKKIFLPIIHCIAYTGLETAGF